MNVRRAAIHFMLAAALTMVVETACSQAPAPSQSPEPSGLVITKIHTTDGTLFVTSRYAVTHSFVVIDEILRDNKYYPDPTDPHLYQKPEATKAPAGGLDLPVMIPLKQVKSIEPWRAPHKTRDGVLIGIGLVVAVGIAAMVAFAASFDPGY
jgi:hypothetical protein